MARFPSSCQFKASNYNATIKLNVLGFLSVLCMRVNIMFIISERRGTSLQRNLLYDHYHISVFYGWDFGHYTFWDRSMTDQGGGG